MRMELVAENGFTVSILRGSRKELGRGSELAIHDKTVSRHQIVLELQEPRKEASSVDCNGGVSVKVLGANPVCILHARQSTGRKGDVQQMSLLRKGEMDTLYPGDKISLSLSLPMFLTVRQTEGRKDEASSETEGRAGNSGGSFKERGTPLNGQGSKQLAEDDLLQMWKGRKVMKGSGSCITHDREQAETSENRGVSINDVTSAEEEAGIAEAVARRQKRALERRQEHRHDSLAKAVKDSEVAANTFKNEGSKIEDMVVNTENIDPVKEFGFLVEGSEFEQYKKRRKSEGGRWIWPPTVKKLAESRSDEEDEEDMQAKPTGKNRAGKDDEEWRGDNPDEKVAISSAKKKPRAGAKVNLRSHGASSSKKKGTVGKRPRVGASGVKGRRKEAEKEEEDDEADETLGGFIVNDDDEEEDGNGASDEEDEISDDEDLDEELDDEDTDAELDPTQEQDDQAAQQSKRKTEKEKKPLCKYGKNCYRKNRDHLAEFRH